MHRYTTHHHGHHRRHGLPLVRRVYRSHAVPVILLRDADTTTGYDLALITTDLTSPTATIVERCTARWSIEVAIEDAKQLTSVGETRNRTPTAVERTVPLGPITQSLIVTWYTPHGHHPNDATERHRTPPNAKPTPPGTPRKPDPHTKT